VVSSSSSATSGIVPPSTEKLPSQPVSPMTSHAAAGMNQAPLYTSSS
jgi:hypothetical protein